MDIEHETRKRRTIDLEDSPFHGPSDLIKLENIEHNFSILSLDLFHYNSGKKEEKVEACGGNQLTLINFQLGEVILELESIVEELGSKMEEE